MRIVVSFFNGVKSSAGWRAIPCFYEAFIRGLKDSGNEVLVLVGTKWQPSEGAFCDAQCRIAAFDPELVLAFNNYGPDFASFLSCPIVVYEVDSPIYYSNQTVLRNYPTRYKYVVSQKESKDLICNAFHVRATDVAIVPFFTEVRRQKIEKQYNISFIGTPFVPPATLWAEARRQNSSRRYAEALRSALDFIRGNPFVAVEELRDRFPAINVTRDFISKAIGHLSFQSRVSVLGEVADLGLTVFGPENWLSLSGENFDLSFCYDSQEVYSLEHYQNVYNRSKICINVNHIQARSGFSWRICDVMASDACLVSEYRSSFKELFPNVRIPTFTNRFEARERCRYVLENPNFRDDVVAQSNEAIERKYRFSHVVEALQSFLGLRIRGDFGNVEYEDLSNVTVPDSPLVSVFVVTYNQELYVDEMLDGLFAQDYPNLEVVISDDNSADGTWEAIKARVDAYVSGGGAHRFILNRNPQNLGLVRNIEKAVELSHGELLVAHGGDDVSLPDRVSRIVRAWNVKGRAPYCIIHGFESIDACSGPFKEKLPYVPNKRTPMGAVMAYRREVFTMFPKMKYARMCEDHPLVRRAVMLGEVLCIPDVLLKYRRGVGMSTDRDLVARRKSISDLGLPAALQTFEDLAARPDLDSDRCEEARQLAVFCLNYYVHEYYSYGLENGWSMRRLVWRILRKEDPVPVLSKKFIRCRIVILLPSVVNRCLTGLVFGLKGLIRAALPGVKKPLKRVRRLAWRLFVALKVKIGVRLVEHGLASARARVQKGLSVRVAFLQLFPASNQNFAVFEMMRAHPAFEPRFIVYPDAMRSDEFAKENYRKTIDVLVRRFGRDFVLEGINEDGKAIDYRDRFDLMTTSNPYEDLAPRIFRVGQWVKKGVPAFYISYFYMGRCYVTPWNLRMPSMSFFWRVYVENNEVLTQARKHQFCRGRNCVLAGCTKMDEYERHCPRKFDRKRILVAPHHSIEQAPTAAGAFAEYAESFLRLVSEFPEVDFVFRPHPLLLQKLRGKEKVKGFRPWGDEGVDAYMARLRAMPNVIISDGGDYLQEFADSDALIHDCGSFQAEYLFTGKPCAYVHRACVDVTKLFLPLGIGCVNAHYGIRSPEDAISFVRNVVLKGNDPKAEFRKRFAQEHLMHNYPNVSAYIFSDLKKQLRVVD